MIWISISLWPQVLLSPLQSLQPRWPPWTQEEHFCLRAFESLFPCMKCSFSGEPHFAPLPVSVPKLERLPLDPFMIKQQLPPWPWERLKAGGEEDDRGWDGGLAWTWVWAKSRRWWTGKPGVLQSVGSHKAKHSWETGQQQTSPGPLHLQPSLFLLSLLCFSLQHLSPSEVSYV